jgi:hypothetical protein
LEGSSTYNKRDEDGDTHTERERERVVCVKEEANDKREKKMVRTGRIEEIKFQIKKRDKRREIVLYGPSGGLFFLAV